MSYLMIVIGVLVCVAFIVLIERKVLGYIQIRKGPNKIGYIGILQSFRDAIKLFTKEQLIPCWTNLIMFFLAPVISFIIILVLWVVLPIDGNYLNIRLGVLVFFCCTRFRVYRLIGRGWSSNSSYAILGAIRGVAQTVSYEVSIAFFFIALICLRGRFNLSYFSLHQEITYFLILIFPLFIIWLITSLAETNRTPFDFAEGESELVSGFNVEYGRGGFALLFLAEYGRIIFISYFIVILFFGGFINVIMLNFYGVLICVVFVWIRGTYPRLRYDKLIIIAWKSLLPVSLCYLIFFYYIKNLVIVLV